MKETDCALLANAWHAWNIIRGVAFERFEIEELRFFEAVLLFYGSNIELLNVGKTTFKLIHVDVVIDDLKHIKVARNNLDANILGVGLACEGTDYVVSLVIVEFIERNMEGFEELH